MTVIADTSALVALIDADEQNHALADSYWRRAEAEDLVTHAYVVAETLAVVRRRLGWNGIDDVVDRLLPRLRIEMVERDLHDEAFSAFRGERGGKSFVDQVTVAFARRNGIAAAFAFDRDLTSAGLRFP